MSKPNLFNKKNKINKIFLYHNYNNLLHHKAKYGQNMIEMKQLNYNKKD